MMNNTNHIPNLTDGLTLTPDYRTGERDLPTQGSEVRFRGRKFTVLTVDPEAPDARVALVCVAHDTGRDAVLFLHEVDAIFVR